MTNRKCCNWCMVYYCLLLLRIILVKVTFINEVECSSVLIRAVILN
jgi:hypothetical protein